MSLVVGYNGDQFQIWCSDGLTVKLDQGKLVASDIAVKKIHRFPENNVLCGWVGDKYDAERTLETLFRHKVESESQLLIHAANTCKNINCLSRQYCLKNNQIFCPTALLLGGYPTNKSFLSIITPDGRIIKKKRFAAIGSGASVIAKYLSSPPTYPMSVENTRIMLVDSLIKTSRECQYVKGEIYTVLLTHQTFEVMETVEITWSPC